MNVERRNRENARFAWNWAACFINRSLSPKVNWTFSDNRKDQDWINCFLPQKKKAEEEGADMDKDYHSRYPPCLKDGAGGDRPKAYEQRVVSLGHVQGSRVIQEYAWKVWRLVKGDRLM